MNDVLALVAGERLRQEELWGQQDHHPFAWVTILGEEFGEAAQASLGAHFGQPSPKTRDRWESYERELVQVAAVAVAAVESLRRNELKAGDA